MNSAASRRTKIRPPRKSIGVSNSTSNGPFDYDLSWQDLAKAIEQIQHKNVSSLLYEQLYRKAYVAVLGKCGEKLYKDVSELVTKHLLTRREAVLNLLNGTFTNTNEELLKAVVQEWTEHLQMMKFISDVLMYLNRAYVRENKKLLTYDLGIVLFDVSFLRYNNMEVGSRLISTVVDEISKSRSGQVIKTKLYLAQVIAMLEILLEDRVGTNLSVPSAQGRSSLYHDEFEFQLLSASESYFSELANNYMSAANGTKYLHDVQLFIKDEEFRLRSLLPRQESSEAITHSDTFSKVKSIMDNTLIKNYIDRVITYPNENQGLLFWLEPLLVASCDAAMSPTMFVGFSRDNIKELQTLYTLVGRIDADRNLLKYHLRETIVAQGSRLTTLITSHLEQVSAANATAGSKKLSSGVNSSSFAVLWVSIILDYHRRLLNVVQNAFEGDPSVSQTIYGAVREFVNASNQGPSKRGSLSPSTNAPELLSIFMDHHIKSLSKSIGSSKLATDTNVSVDELEDFITKSISFLTLIKDKDAFEAHYAAHFAKRFLSAKSSHSVSWGLAGTDLEELIIAKLGDEMGRGGSSFEKIVKMRRDVKLSHDLTSEWKSHVSQNKLDLVELELKICNLSEWPKSMTKDYKNFSNQDGEIGFIWPSVLRKTMRTFEEYWLSEKKNDNKTLYWSPKFGLIDMIITYPTKTYDINLSTLAGVIMLLFAPLSTDALGEPVLAFAEKRVLKYEEIRDLTKIAEPELKRQLQSIAVAPRLRLLVKSPMTKEVNEGDEFRLNEKFKSPTSKVRVLTVSSSSSRAESTKAEKQDEEKEVRGNIEEGRKQLLNAAIVRVMKSRQTLSHNELIEELLKQLQNRFEPLMTVIKRRIEDLIDKEYLKRDDLEHSVYHYIA
ncbi:hypothetical protein PUMCH_004187 [Australozyma saopauloensis]|uniref:Cullin family profile domain-containing protein n=1 Tax=Australozyma saopauloensis TaxID=291208 RepID=A0AAX4HE78_9ASCO|nr:hypothetical protein PUMCH_004187 [[Candida] saopauloensis]